MRILFCGDCIARVGREALARGLGRLRERLGVDLCVANVENAANLFGITAAVVDEIARSGVDVMTSGNHVWDKREGLDVLDARSDILRPANYPPGVPGRGFLVRAAGDIPIAVINLQGRTFMPPIDCPFRAADAVLAGLPAEVRIAIVDFHAEATSEKLAMGYYLDGRVSAVIGTHTHVPTADEQILPGGTAYITDVGMTGPRGSVIGVKPGIVIERFLRALPVRFEVASEPAAIDAVWIDVDEGSGKARAIRRVREEIGEEARG